MEEKSLDFKINEHISEGERLLWQGAPAKKMRLLPGERFNIILGIAWTAFSIAWLALAISLNVEAKDAIFLVKILPAFGVPFLLVGLYFLAFVPLNIIIFRKGIEYALTNKRALILLRGRRDKLVSFSLTEIENIQFGCDEDGNGYVTFINVPKKPDGQKKRRKPLIKRVGGFYNVSEVKKLYKIFCAQIGEAEK